MNEIYKVPGLADASEPYDVWATPEYYPQPNEREVPLLNVLGRATMRCVQELYLNLTDTSGQHRAPRRLHLR